ncbi:unnamed protein product [Strongylus vulgaris]|uniref:Uncharacterized protein n=1 Tax=Strongylus vulgaris TaxID=40348 RepID=A0A3P7JSE7_STRVU|nr:unnamed protein product [Strongylus vulgaris]
MPMVPFPYFSSSLMVSSTETLPESILSLETLSCARLALAKSATLSKLS